MKKYLGTLAGAYLGFSTTFFMGFTLLNWQWWVVCIPTIILFSGDKILNK